MVVGHKTGRRVIVNKSGIKYHYIHIYRILRKWGFKQKVPRKLHINTASTEEKEKFKKRQNRYLWINNNSNNKMKRKNGFIIVSVDESFFFYDFLVKRVWIERYKRPIIRVTGSHQHSCIFGAISIEGKKRTIYSDSTMYSIVIHFLNYIKKIHAKFPKCDLFMDKASQHYKSKKVIKYFEDNKDTLIPVYLPTAASPEFMVMGRSGI